MGFVHDKKQNRLDAQHAIDLTYIYHNLRVRDSITPSQYRAAMVEWEGQSEEESEKEEEDEDTEGNDEDTEMGTSSKRAKTGDGTGCSGAGSVANA